MEIVNQLMMDVDAFLIFFYRLSEVPIVGYLTGTAVLALLCVVIGQTTIFAAFSVNRKMIRGQNREMVRMQNLSVYALLNKDKPAYKACNSQANDAFGKVFFTQITLSASALWPIPFALGWMQTRFTGVSFQLPFNLPFIGQSVGYPFTFIPTFVLVYILFGKVKHRLPVFSTLEKKIDEVVEGTEDLVSLADAAPVRGKL